VKVPPGIQAMRAGFDALAGARWALIVWAWMSFTGEDGKSGGCPTVPTPRAVVKPGVAPRAARHGTARGTAPADALRRELPSAAACLA